MSEIISIPWGGGVYSLDEKEIGTWIDGKTIYQRTFIDVYNSGNNTGTGIIATITGAASSIDKAIFGWVTCVTNNGLDKDFNGYLNFAVRQEGNDIIVDSKANLNKVTHLNVTVQYTKITE